MVECGMWNGIEDELYRRSNQVERRRNAIKYTFGGQLTRHKFRISLSSFAEHSSQAKVFIPDRIHEDSITSRNQLNALRVLW